MNSIKYLLVFCILLLQACTAQIPLQTNLHLKVPSQTADIFPSSTMISISGKDERSEKDVLVFAIKNDPPIGLTNTNPPHLLLAEALSTGFQRQGLTVYKESPIRLTISIKKLLLNVTKPEILYQSKLSTEIYIVVENSKKRTQFSKTYTAAVVEESVQRPKIDFLESMIAKQVDEIVQQILSNQEIRAVIN